MVSTTTLTLNRSDMTLTKTTPYHHTYSGVIILLRFDLFPLLCTVIHDVSLSDLSLYLLGDEEGIEPLKAHMVIDDIFDQVGQHCMKCK